MSFLKWFFLGKARGEKTDHRKPFYIEVAPLDAASESDPEKLHLLHTSCGGLFKAETRGSQLELNCFRCKVFLRIESGEFGIGAFYATAQDGTGHWVRGRRSFPQEFREDPEYCGIYVQKSKSEHDNVAPSA